MANEELVAVPFVKDVLAHCCELKRVVFYAVLDRASRDDTRALLTEYSRREPRLQVVWAPDNRCIVDAYVRGYREALAANHDYILEMDAGYSHRPCDLPQFFDALEEGYACVFGSRFMPGGRIENTPPARRLLSHLGSLVTNALVGTQLRDMTSGFELFSRRALQMVLDRGIRSRAHFFQTEIKFYCRHLRVKEVPITYTTDSATVGCRPIFDALVNLGRICKLRWFRDQPPAAPICH